MIHRVTVESNRVTVESNRVTVESKRVLPNGWNQLSHENNSSTPLGVTVPRVLCHTKSKQLWNTHSLMWIRFFYATFEPQTNGSICFHGNNKRLTGQLLLLQIYIRNVEIAYW